MLQKTELARRARAMLAGVILAVIATGVCVQPARSADLATPAASRPAASQDQFVDPLDAPAFMRASAAGQPVMAVARAGSRLVAVGMRGLIFISDDEAKTWRQVGAPVRSDLLALSFPDATNGWAVGHDGVVLHTADGGLSWTRQLDGRIAATALIQQYRKAITGGNAALQPYLDQLTLNYKAGPSLPLLSVWFRDAQHGMAVGPFGMAVATQDGGKSWQPMLERFDNPQFLHLNAVYGQGDDVCVAAEQGTVFRLDRASGRFVAVKTGYAGSFFGVTGDGQALFAYGLRGTIYRSADHGLSWTAVPSQLHGAVTGAAPLQSRGKIALVTAAGEAALYDDRTGSLRPVPVARTSVLTGVLALHDGRLAITTLAGPAVVSAQ